MSPNARWTVGILVAAVGCKTEGSAGAYQDASTDRVAPHSKSAPSSGAKGPNVPSRNAFTCRKQITGKRSTGELSVQWTSSANRAAVVMIFDSTSDCAFRAEWRFPEGNFVFRADPQRWSSKCSTSPHSPFAIACYLGHQSDLAHVTQTLRAEWTLRTSGSSVERSIAFVAGWPSEVITGATLDSRCSLLPVQTGKINPVATLDGEFARFEEAQCRFD